MPMAEIFKIVNGKIREVEAIGVRFPYSSAPVGNSEVTACESPPKDRSTIPQEIRNRLGLLPHTKVEFELAGDHAAHSAKPATPEKAPEAPGPGGPPRHR